MWEKIENIDIQNNQVEDLVNNQLEWLFTQFISSDKKEELKKIDFSDNSRKTKAEQIFDTRLSEDPTIIDNLINLEDKDAEQEIETEIKQSEINLNTLQNEVGIKQELEQLKLSIELDPKIQERIQEIEKSEGFDPEKELELRDYIQAWKRWKAIQEIFNIIWRFFKVDNKIWFDEYDNLDLNLDNKTNDEIQNIIETLEEKINNTWDIKKDLKFTYLLSQAKNKKLENWWTGNKKEQLKKEIEVWDIILLNKKVEKTDHGTKLLKAYWKEYETDFTHSAIITKKDPIRIRHATMSWSTAGLEKWRWVEEVKLSDYRKASNLKWYDALILRPPQNIKDKINTFSDKQIWKKYDLNAAIWWWIRWLDSEWSSHIWWLRKNKTWQFDDHFNCVELIVQWLDDKKLQKITHPNEFLQYMSVFKPTYMTTI